MWLTNDYGRKDPQQVRRVPGRLWRGGHEWELRRRTGYGIYAVNKVVGCMKRQYTDGRRGTSLLALEIVCRRSPGTLKSTLIPRQQVKEFLMLKRRFVNVSCTPYRCQEVLTS